MRQPNASVSPAVTRLFVIVLPLALLATTAADAVLIPGAPWTLLLVISCIVTPTQQEEDKPRPSHRPSKALVATGVAILVYAAGVSLNGNGLSRIRRRYRLPHSSSR